MALVIQVHVGRRGQRRFFAEVQEGLAAIGQMQSHETAAAQVARCGVNHGQRIANGHSRIDGVTSLLEHLHTNAGGQMVGRDDHAVFRGDWGYGGSMDPRHGDTQAKSP